MLYHCFSYMVDHITGGTLLFMGFIIAFMHFNKIRTFDTFKQIMLLLFFGILITLHGISHSLSFYTPC